MAKRARSNTPETKIEEFAEDLGRLLGTAQTKAEGWLSQRQQIAKSLEGIRDTANTLLGQLTGAAAAVRRGYSGRGRPPGSTNKRGRARKRKPGRPKGFKMSEEAKQKMREAWARRKAATKKK